MDQVTLRADTRTAPGSAAARRLRRSGQVPAVVYGRETASTPIAVDARELYGALRTDAGLNAIINLEFDGKELLTVAREVQRHPVRGEIIHLDFVNISLTEAIEAEVALEPEGIPLGVSRDGGILESVRTSVMVEALPTDIPPQIVIDVTALEIGDSLKVSDLPEVEGVTYVEEPEHTLFTVLAPRLAEEEEVEEEEELLEGEEAEGVAEAEAGEQAAADDEE